MGFPVSADKICTASVPLPCDGISAMGANQQKALKFHRVLANPLPMKGYSQFTVSRI
jgi:hypothetical protein